MRNQVSQLAQIALAHTVAHMPSWSEYVQRLAGGLTSKEIAARVGVDSSQVSRWKNGQVPTAENALRFAEEFDGDPFEALIAAGHGRHVPPDGRHAGDVVRQDESELRQQEGAGSERANSYGQAALAAQQVWPIGDRFFRVLDGMDWASDDMKASLALVWADLSTDLADALYQAIEQGEAPRAMAAGPYAEAEMAVRRFVEVHDRYVPQKERLSGRVAKLDVQFSAQEGIDNVREQEDVVEATSESDASGEAQQGQEVSAPAEGDDAATAVKRNLPDRVKDLSGLGGVPGVDGGGGQGDMEGGHDAVC